MRLPFQTISKIESAICLSDESYTPKERIIRHVIKNPCPIDLSTIIHQDFFIEMFNYSLPSSKMSQLVKRSSALCDTVVKIHPRICHIIGYREDEISKYFKRDIYVNLGNGYLAILTKKNPIMVEIAQDIIAKVKISTLSSFFNGTGKPCLFSKQNTSLYSAMFRINATVLPKNDSDISNDVYITNKTKLKVYNTFIRKMITNNHITIFTKVRDYVIIKRDFYEPIGNFIFFTPTWAILGLIKCVLSPDQFKEFNARMATLKMYKMLSTTTTNPNLKHLQCCIDNGAIMTYPPPFYYNGKSIITHALRLKNNSVLAEILTATPIEEIVKHDYNTKDITTLKKTLNSISNPVN